MPISRFGQWSRRNVRSGHAYAEVSALHRNSAYGVWRPNVRRALLWSGLLPAAAIAGFAVHYSSFALLLAYPLQVVRRAWSRSPDINGRLTHAFFETLAKFPETQGIMKYYIHRATKKRANIIEYK
jgi:hypothetical protein